MASQYPMNVSVEVLIGDKVGNIGRVTVGVEPGKIPTHEDIVLAIAQAHEIAVQNKMRVPETPKAFLEMRALEMFGQRLCVAADNDAFAYTADELKAAIEKVKGGWK